MFVAGHLTLERSPITHRKWHEACTISTGTRYSIGISRYLILNPNAAVANHQPYCLPQSANILVDGDEGEFFKSVKLCDFNISTFRSDAFSRVGTPRTIRFFLFLIIPIKLLRSEYMAPELLSNTDGRAFDTEKADSTRPPFRALRSMLC